MNQQAPLRTPPKPQAKAAAPSVDNRPLVRFLALTLVVSTVMLVLALILGFVALSMRENPRDDAPKEPSKENIQSQKPDLPVSTGRGAVATVPSRSDYEISNGSNYDTIDGISTKHALLLDLKSYQAIAGKGADTRVCPASMTKVMTVLVVCENLKSLDDKLAYTAEVIYESQKGDGSGQSALWMEGNEFTVENLLYLAFLQSDTAACKTLANYIAGNEDAFTELMNQKAREIGMDDTVFCNSTGLSVKGKEYYSTCRDIAMLWAYAMDNPLAKRVLTATDWQVEYTNPSLGTRYMLNEATWWSKRVKPYLETVKRPITPILETVTLKSGKTGYETVPKACLVSYATSNNGDGEYVLVVVSGVDNNTSTKDVIRIYDTYAK